MNFGAADGACGKPEDWSHDPANCLAAAGYSALMVEGDQQPLGAAWRSLAQPGGSHSCSAASAGRTSPWCGWASCAVQSQVLGYLPLANVTQVVEQFVSDILPANSSPDLLKALAQKTNRNGGKVDVDNADCLFMEEVRMAFALGRALEALRATKPKIMHLELQPRAPPPLEYVQEYLPHQEIPSSCHVVKAVSRGLASC